MLRRLVLVGLLTACSPPDGWTPETYEELAHLGPLPPLPPSPTNAWADDVDAARLGEQLYTDTRLSSDGQQSCASCHASEDAFAAPTRLGEGIGTTALHPPTVLNSGYQRWMFWDGRSDSLWAQALKPLEAPLEQGTNRVALAHRFSEEADLRASYEALFGPLPDTAGLPPSARPIPSDPTHPEHIAWLALDASQQDAINRFFSNLGKAIAAYERTVVTGDSPFDAYWRSLFEGERESRNAITEQQKRGLGLFVGKAGCFFCHSGPTFSNLQFHNIGLGPRDWLDNTDLGRHDGISAVLADPFNGAGAYSDDPVTGAEKLDFMARPDGEDDDLRHGQMKTPSLRNIALTPPYMHGGHFETLDEVVAYYRDLPETPAVGHRDETLVPLDLDEDEMADLVAFLEALTGPMPPE